MGRGRAGGGAVPWRRQRRAAGTDGLRPRQARTRAYAQAHPCFRQPAAFVRGQGAQERRPGFRHQGDRMNRPVTRLCAHHLEGMSYRDADLVEDLIGKKTFTEVMFSQIMGREARPVDLRIVDAVLITLMEHGLTPSAIATRVVYMSAPENLQRAVAAGLMAVGSSFLGTMENCSQLLALILWAAAPAAEARAIVQAKRQASKPSPGSGHHRHKPNDPRPIKLLQLARAEPDLQGKWVGALELLARTVDEVY